MKTERNVQLYQLTRPVEREGDKYQKAFLIKGATLDLESWPHEDIFANTIIYSITTQITYMGLKKKTTTLTKIIIHQ